MDHLDITDKLRRRVLLGLTLTLCICALLVTLVNLLKGNYAIAWMDLFLALFCAFVAWQLQNKQYYPWQPYAIVYLYTMAIVLVSIAGGLQSGIPFWLLTFPVLFYFLFGRTHGFIASMLILIGMTLVLYLNTPKGETVEILSILVNLVLAYCLVFAVAHTYELNREANEEALFQLASRDPLTQVRNRFSLVYQFSDISCDARCCLVLIDVDRFKSINDRFGHEMGDRVLLQMTTLLRQNMGDENVYRIGGEEFVLTFWNTPNDTAISQVETLRECISQHTFGSKDTRFSLTVSIGVSYGKAHGSLSALLKQADEYLYKAKENGRNRVFFAPSFIQHE